MKYTLSLLMALCCLATALHAQDIVELTSGTSVRGIIQRFDGRGVTVQKEDGNNIMVPAAAVTGFFWKGGNYVKKTIFDRQKATDVFMRELAAGKLNLYEFGGATALVKPAEKTRLRRPQIDIGLGTGMGGMMGGGITFGGNRGVPEARPAPYSYFIEKPGIKGIQPLPYRPGTTPEDSRLLKQFLSTYVADDADAVAALQSLEVVTKTDMVNLVKAYNAPHVSVGLQ